MEILSRQEYLQEIHKYLGKQTIVVLTGQRRIGKSYVLLDLKKELSADPQNNVIFTHYAPCTTRLTRGSGGLFYKCNIPLLRQPAIRLII